MEGLALIFIGLLGLIALYFFLRSNISYHIASQNLEIRILGVTVRRLPLADVHSISKYHDGFAENWTNTFRPRKRRLVLKRRSGWVRNFVITPEQRYVFKRMLKEAMHQEVTEDED